MNCPVCGKPVRFYHSREVKILKGLKLKYHSYCYQTTIGKAERQAIAKQIRNYKMMRIDDGNQ